MRTIEVDEEVFKFLEENAKPFVDTPNSVLKRLLLGAEGEPTEPRGPSKGSGKSGPNSRGGDPDMFMQVILGSRFGDGFQRKSPYRMMFESESQIAYFQNFSKRDAETLWYRLNPGAIESMRSTGKPATVCFTNPADRCAYLVPLQKIEERVKMVEWNRPEIEVNIDHGNSRWRELNWDIKAYYAEFPESSRD